MKKLTLLFATLLMLVSSIVFCGCNDGYKKLKIELTSIEYASENYLAKDGEITLVLDEEKLSVCRVNLELSGAKSWGDISVVSSPTGVVKVEKCETSKKECSVQIKALQPVEGASLVITHLGSGKSLSVPLNIGRKLQTVASSGNSYIIEMPEFPKIETPESPEEDLEDDNDEILAQADVDNAEGEAGDNKVEEETVKEFLIPTKELLNCKPANYTDTIVWTVKEAVLPAGVEVVSYNKKGERLDKAFEKLDQGGDAGTDNSVKLQGVSAAVSSKIVISRECSASSTITLRPISILDGKAILHTDVEVKVWIIDLLKYDEVQVTSPTHKEEITASEPASDLLKDLVLISNPDPNPNKMRKIEGLSGYDFYSTALIECKTLKEGELQDLVEEFTVFNGLENIKKSYLDFYKMEIFTNIDALSLEQTDFGKVRAIATSTCVGSGEITIKFIPNDCVGVIEGFEISIPCTVGERATSFKASNNGENIKIDKKDEYNFSSLTPLNDSTSLGQAFRFEVLSTHTLGALKGYKITINKNLLYIDTDKIEKVEEGEGVTKHYSRYIKDMPGADGKAIDLTEIIANRYKYQISILKDGREITFYEDGENLVSEPLTPRNTIYMKWVQQANGQELVKEVPFEINISNYYDESYDILNNGFTNTIINYKLEFNRQRTVESISYTPVKVITDGGINIVTASDAESGWQFYFEPTMLKNAQTFYGLRIDEVFGLNNTTLTPSELGNVNIEIVAKHLGIDIVDDSVNLGFALYNTSLIGTGFTYKAMTNENSNAFNYDSEKEDNNIVLIGKTNQNETVDYGDYQIEFKQTGRAIGAPRNIRVYKQLEEDDVTINIPTADFGGSALAYTKLDAKPKGEYYELSGGQYIKVVNDSWDPNKLYYSKTQGYVQLTSKPKDWDTAWASYYEYDGTEYKAVTDNNWNTEKTYYKLVDAFLINQGKKAIEVSNAYVLSTAKQYLVDIQIENESFVSIDGQSVEASIVANSDEKLNDGYALSLPAKNPSAQDMIITGNSGLFNSSTNERNYAQLTYTIETNTYDYYKLDEKATNKISKTIYVYVYQPVVSATFDRTMIYKYDYDSIPNPQLKDIYGKQTLNIELNDGDKDLFNYVDIKWTTGGDGIKEYVTGKGGDSSTYTFANSNNTKTTGRIIATITQFGRQYPIYCGYEVRRPILSEQIILDTTINTFRSGKGYINLKVGETLQIEASAKSSKGEVSFEGFEYVVCSTTGYAIDGVASVDNTGLLTAKNSGKAKLIIVAKDVLKTSSLSGIINYFNTGAYIENKAYLMIDIIVSDGSEEYPYLIASAKDFEAIKLDFDNGTNANHYALVADIDLNGKAISFGDFSGTIRSFQEDETLTNNRFSIYGIMLNENCPTLFNKLTAQDNGLANLKDIDLYIDINYIATQANGNVLIGLVGENQGLIENITISISGKVDARGLVNNYTIGSIAAKNIGKGVIKINDTTLVGVQGKLVVDNSSSSIVVIGGAVGYNEARLIGANAEPEISDVDSTVEYAVYYDKQGAMVDIELQLSGVDMAKLSDSAMGGAVGINKGTIENVYVTGKILGIDNAKNLKVNNVGGLIGKNINTTTLSATITTANAGGYKHISEVKFSSDTFQVVNSYSSTQVMGNNNVGGAVGYDELGNYKKVYYEIYNAEQSVKGNNNVGGLIGYAKDSSLSYCYSNSFAWNYGNTVEVYDIIGANNVGGLIGLAESSRTSSFDENITNSAMNIVGSLASVSVTGDSDTSGLIGRLNGYGAIYGAYYYGVMDSNTVNNNHPFVNMYTGNNKNTTQNPYNNAYAIVNGEVKLNYLLTGSIVGKLFNDGTPTATLIKADNDCFDVNKEYNNGKPYMVYTYKDDKGDDDATNDVEVKVNLVTIVPTIIQINKAFELYIYNDSLYKENRLGDYVKVSKDGGKTFEMQVYNPNNEDYKGLTRYALMASVVDAETSNSNLSDYRQKALILYYYQFNDMSGENALKDSYYLNTIDMHDIINDKGIIVLPSTIKRFNLRTSDSSVVSVLSEGKLLLLNEGQATITLVSTLNPSITASFVVIVRSKVLEFGLYSSANLREEYNIDGKTISIVKNSSKLIYANYSSTIEVNSTKYDYKPATNMGVEFSIKYNGSNSSINDSNLYKYIAFNKEYEIYKTDADGNVIKYQVDANGKYVVDGDGNYIVDENGKPIVVGYKIPYGVPITISVNEYVDGDFEITAKPYVIVDYKCSDGTTKILHHHLTSYFETTFTVETKKGASAVNTNKTQINMMPADDASNLDVKVTTDVKLDELYFEVEADGEISEVLDIKNANKVINVAEMLKISDVDLTKITDASGNVVKMAGILSLKDVDFDSENMLQQVSLSLKLNENSHYVDVPFRLQVKLYVKNGTQQIGTTVFINAKPQTISSVIARNYRMSDNATQLGFDNAYQSQVIRPGATNIITVDIAPNIAVYDYVEIVDTTAQDKILFQQVKSDLSSFDNMDTWVDSGIKLNKLNDDGKQDVTVSKLYIIAKLPEKSTANITHQIQITIHKDGEVINTTYLNLEAVMYPTVIATYTDPSGIETVADTREGNINQEITVDADLAVGIEAGIDIVTYNIDDGTLSSSITITKQGDEVSNSEIYTSLVKLEYDTIYEKYILRFANDKQDDWDELIGKEINVNFTASKSLNGVIETCKATIRFTIRRMVIHSVSMTHTSSQGDLYGDWNEEFTAQFYFDKTDISYYNKGYWNIEYTLDNTSYESIDNLTLKQDMQTINALLNAFNTLQTETDESKNSINIYLLDKDNVKTKLSGNYSKNGISIVNKNQSFIIKAKEPTTSNIDNINDMKLRVEFKMNYSPTNYPQLTIDSKAKKLSKEFGFNVTQKTTPFDEYIDISSQQEFEDMLEGKYYRLTRDLTFNNYTPVNVAIGGFTGDGHTITFARQVIGGRSVEAFNIDQLEQNYLSGQMNIGLFGVLAENSVIQNLQVKYLDITINLNDRTAIQQQNANNIYFGGIAGQNQGVITNVKVLGSFKLKTQYISADHIYIGGITAENGSTDSTKVATITGSTVELEISAMALAGGISGTNYGKIVNTNFVGKIISNDSNVYVASVVTAGFVVNNMNGAYISLSFVEGSSTGAEHDIHSVGRAAGFVLNNSGTINNCYIGQTTIRSQGSIGGFVYSNTGDISNSYGYANVGNSLFYNEFIYSSVGNGKLTNCYVITNNEMNINVGGLTKVKIIDIMLQSSYSGFIFTNSTNGVWSISSNGPKLLNAGFNGDVAQYEDIYNIYDVETFEGYFKQVSRGSDIIDNATFRIVRDIDFEAEGFTDNPITFNKTLKANIEGNDMALKNYNIYQSGDFEGVGLFGKIENKSLGIYVRNLILQPTSIKATSGISVGALAGIIDSVKVYNIVLDNSSLLILGKNAVGGLAGIIKGSFEVVGITSNISAFASYVNNNGSQYNLYTGKNITGNKTSDNLSEVSYAGSIAGIVNGFDASGTSMSNRTIDSYYSIKDITIKGDIVLIGETVGGAFGLVGERTLVKNLTYNLASETLYEGVYVSGGLVGENRGIIQTSKIYAQDDNKQRLNTASCFDEFAKVNGAIVGVNLGGLINACSSDIDVCATEGLSTVGGIVGRNIEGSIYNCSVYGTVQGYFAGGIAGTDYSHNTIVNNQTTQGAATYETIKVYKGVQSKVAYNSNCLVDDGTTDGSNIYESGKLYKNNEVTNTFITRFIATKSKYYMFEPSYIDNQSGGLVSANSVFGFAVGLTDRIFNVTINENEKEKDILTSSGGIKMTLSTSVQSERKDYTLKYDDKECKITPISNIKDSGNKLGIKYDIANAEIFYIVAYDDAGYDFWDATRGFTQQYIAISTSPLQEYVAQPI